MASSRADSGVSSLLIANENLRRDLLLKDNELAKVRKLLDDKERKLDEAVAQRTGATRELDRLTRDTEKLHREISILRTDKASLEAAAADNAVYTKKLEARLTSGGKDFLLEQNTRMKQGLQQGALEAEALRASVAAHKSELERAMREIEVLVRSSRRPPRFRLLLAHLAFLSLCHLSSLSFRRLPRSSFVPRSCT